jgi:hypothetical protein
MKNPLSRRLVTTAGARRRPGCGRFHGEMRCEIQNRPGSHVRQPQQSEELEA